MEPRSVEDSIACFVTGYYNNDPHGAKLATQHIQAMHGKHTTPAERAVNDEYRKQKRRVFRCRGGCGLAFHKPTTCYWCKRGR